MELSAKNVEQRSEVRDQILLKNLRSSFGAPVKTGKVL